MQHTYPKGRIVIVGAGIGGLCAGALLAQKGLDVTVLETHSIPGGCASTFSRSGFRFDAGATVGCGFHRNGPLDRLGRDLGITWPLMPSPVAWEYHCGDLSLQLDHMREDILARFPGSAPFWKEQEEAATLLWSLTKKGVAWPPASAGDIGRLAARMPGKISDLALLVKLAGSTIQQWLGRHGLDADSELIRFIDAQLLISLQTTSSEANALFGAIALDLPVRGTHRITGGIGTVARELAVSIEKNGGRVLYGKEAVTIEVDKGKARTVTTADRERYEADAFICNLTPGSLAALCPEAVSGRKGNKGGWSAYMLYLGLEEEVCEKSGCHLQLLRPDAPLGECGSIFASISPSDDSLRAPEGKRAMTVSTHTRPGHWWQALKQGNDAYDALRKGYRDDVLSLLEDAIPGIGNHIVVEHDATPVSWERWTGRKGGFVGGTPQTGLMGVRGPRTKLGNLFLAGDSVFPGQSLPGVTTGARRTAELVEMLLNRLQGKQ